MAYTPEQIHAYRESINGDPHTSFKMLAHFASADPKFDADEDWDALCDYLVAQAPTQSRIAEIVDRYAAALQKSSSELLRVIEEDTRNNYFLSGIALHSAGIPKTVPVAAWAAFNKKEYVGLPGEWALLRFLGWSGFDLNASDTGGATPLHYLASQNNPPFSTPKAVSWLIGHGADVHAVSARGDTPLIYMSGARNWSRSLSESFAILVNSGADPFQKAADGESAESLLTALDAQIPNPDRRSLLDAIGALRADIERAELDAVAGEGHDAERRRPVLSI